jgi:DNA-binding Lrp family transcriptional regulator
LKEAQVSSQLTEFDRRLLDRMQRDVPLTARPYAAIADALETTEQVVLDRIRALAGPPPAPIRQISAIFDSKAIGYQGCLVAARVDRGAIGRAADVINRHPGVSHNYQREHAYNLWFTLAVPPDSRLGLERTVDLLRRLSGAEQMRLMPAIKLYKIGVRFDLGVDSATDSSPDVAHRESAASFNVTDIDKSMIRVLQQHLPVEQRPFDAWADQAGVTVEQLLAAAARYRDAGVMRRFSAVLRHREIGVAANAMGVWEVPPAARDAFGEMAARHPAVSHCYQRPTYPDWPYSIFTMVHGTSRIDCEAALASISLAGGIMDYTSLYSIEEFKKVRVKYFVGDIEQWEAVHATDAAQARR